MNHHGSSVVSPISEVPTQIRARKTASTGGNRSWSEEEENYLLQTRMQKMPYKHIAAHLKKTELACRLHFHQLSHGSHRRKRTTSMSSYASSTSAEHSPYLGHQPYDTPESAIDSRQSSPMSYTSTPPQSIHASPATRYPHHKPLLPKPSPLTPRHSPDLQEPHLRINTSDSVVHLPHPQDPTAGVDTARLRAIYESRRTHFWASIAADYGADIPPQQLEAFWQKSGAVRPPTPEASPDGSRTKRPELRPSVFPYQPEQTRGFTPVNHYANERPSYTLPPPQPSAPRLNRSWSTGSNLPIAALLTEDRDPRRE